MRLKSLELAGFKSFAKKTSFLFNAPVTAIVGPNGSGKSNCAEAFRWVLGERSIKSLRGARGEDLIFSGPPAALGGGGARLNRAGVTLVFDNRDRLFNLDFDEVALSREVYRDGVNSYLLNGSAVRQRDIIELLNAVALGGSDHYIVNQGDADRLLRANARERWLMIEDALGLRLYEWKIEESEKKLVKTEENVKQAEALRRELGPHLKFLKKQAEKAERARALRHELKQLYFEYLKREEHYLEREEQALAAAKLGLEQSLARIETQLEQAAAPGPLPEIERRLRELADRQAELTRALGRLEGRLESRPGATITPVRHSLAYDEVADFAAAIERMVAVALGFSDIFSIKEALAKLRARAVDFLTQMRGTPGPTAPPVDLAEIQTEQARFEQELTTTKQVEQALLTERRASELATRETYELRAQKSELANRLNKALLRGETLARDRAEFERELTEGVALVDREIKRYAELGPAPADSDRAAQSERRRQLERLKIRLEELGGESVDTLKEYESATERDQFLAKELSDLAASADSLQQIVDELRTKISQDFNAGLARINRQFQEFFALMFGGGSASLELVKMKNRVVDEAEFLPEVPGNDDAPDGVEIRVNLPRKKIRGLEMLSGGERALCSIALLFAMSQVNPPPFLILDETDAALDEANSRKYGELVANLARHSQLILITHNRETMNRADVIYGITMGADGVSRQLSIKFDEAAGYAK